MLRRRVDVHHQRHVVDVHPAGGHVGGHQHAHLAAAEGRQVPVAGRLGEVALQVDGRDAVRGQLLGQALGDVLGPHEQDGALLAGGQRLDEPLLRIGVGHAEHRVLQQLDRVGRVVDRVGGGGGQEATDELVHAVVQRRGEQQPLTAGRCGREDARDRRQEAEVGHVVRLVEHGDADGAEPDVALLHQVLEAPGARDHHVDAGLQGLHLPVLRDAAEDGGHAVPGRGEQRLERRGDLGGELTGGREHERGRVARPRPRPCGRQARDHGKGEGERLAAAGAAAAEHVPAGERVGEGVALDGERLVDALRVQDGDEAGGDAEGVEGGGHGLLSREGRCDALKGTVRDTRTPAGAGGGSPSIRVWAPGAAGSVRRREAQECAGWPQRTCWRTSAPPRRGAGSLDWARICALTCASPRRAPSVGPT